MLWYFNKRNYINPSNKACDFRCTTCTMGDNFHCSACNAVKGFNLSISTLSCDCTDKDSYLNQNFAICQGS